MSENNSPLANSIMLKMKIDKNHPSIAGHFPDNPIVPGVVILDQIMLLWQHESGQTINRILNTKFVNLLRPDASCTIQYTPKTAQKIDFIVSTINEHSFEASGEHSFEQKQSTPTIICKGLFSYE